MGDRGGQNSWLLRRHQFEAIIAGDAAENTGSVCIKSLQSLCAEGVPHEPSQIRPTVYSLLLGVLPLERSTWQSVRRQRRREYYALVDQLVNRADVDLIRIAADVERISKRYPQLLRRSRPRRSSRLYPSRRTKEDTDSGSETEVDLTPIFDRRSIFHRIFELRRESTPMRAEPPRIILSVEPTSPAFPTEKTLLSPQKAMRQAEDSKFDTHLEVMIRLLAILSTSHTYNPAFTPTLAVLYLTYAQALHNDAPPSFGEEEAYWVMKAVLNRLSGVWQDTMLHLSMIGQRLQWADEHLHAILLANDLDPALPLYTFRWVTELWASDLPLPSTLSLWDIVFSASKPLNAIVDLNCAILIASKKHLARPTITKGLWGDIEEASGVDFVQTLTFLRNIPLQHIGGGQAIIDSYLALGATGDIDYPVKSPKTELASRLAGLTLSVGPDRSPTTRSKFETYPTPPRPLMLQEKARRASNPSSAPLRRSSTSSSASIETTIISPPASVNMYRLRSRQDSPGPRRNLLYDQL